MKKAFLLLLFLWINCYLCLAQDIFTAGRCFYDVFVKSDPLTVGAERRGTFAVYPNPARESLCIDGIEEGDGIGIYDMEGRLVRREESNSASTIDVRSLSPGLYWVRCGDQAVPFVKD